MEVKLKDIVVIPSHWTNLYHTTSPVITGDIERVLQEEKLVFDREYYQTTNWGRVSFSTPEYRQHWLIVQIKTEPQRRLTEMLARRYGLFKITDIRQFALSLKIERTKKSTRVYRESYDDLRLEGGTLGSAYKLSEELNNTTSPLLGYDVLSAMVTKQKRKISNRKEMYASVDDKQYTITSKTLKEVKKLQKSYPKAYTKVNWVLVAKGLIGAQEFRTFNTIKEENILKGVSW